MVIFDVGHYTCCECLCSIKGRALITIDADGLRKSFHPACCDLLKPGAPQKWQEKGVDPAVREDQQAQGRVGGSDMITGQNELEIALGQLARFQGMLEAMRLRLQQTAPQLFPLVSEAYLRRIEALQAEIMESLRERPGEEDA